MNIQNTDTQDRSNGERGNVDECPICGRTARLIALPAGQACEECSRMFVSQQETGGRGREADQMAEQEPTEGGARPNLQVFPEQIPLELREAKRWAAWGVDGTKRPVGPDGMPISWTDETALVTFEEIRESQPERGYGIAILEKDPYVAIDLDNCVERPRCAATRKDWVPKLGPFIEAGAHIEWSQSGTGVHVIARVSEGYQLPEGWSNISLEGDHEGIEVKTNSFLVMTGDTVTDDTGVRDSLDPDRIGAVEGCVLDEWLFTTASDLGQPWETPRGDENHEWIPNKSREELSGLSNTRNIEDVRDAVYQLLPSDLPLRSTLTQRRIDGTEDWNPSYRHSKSQTGLAHFGGGHFYDRKVEEHFAVFWLFAADQGLIDAPWDDLRGRTWWTAVEMAREAGAPIPEYVPPASVFG